MASAGSRTAAVDVDSPSADGRNIADEFGGKLGVFAYEPNLAYAATRGGAHDVTGPGRLREGFWLGEKDKGFPQLRTVFVENRAVRKDQTKKISK